MPGQSQPASCLATPKVRDSFGGGTVLGSSLLMSNQDLAHSRCQINCGLMKLTLKDWFFKALYQRPSDQVLPPTASLPSPLPATLSLLGRAASLPPQTLSLHPFHTPFPSRDLCPLGINSPASHCIKTKHSLWALQALAFPLKQLRLHFWGINEDCHSWQPLPTEPQTLPGELG